MAKVSLGKDKIKFLLVEGVHQSAIDTLHAAGYTNIEFHKGALDSEALKESIRDAHFVGIRSRTQLTEEVFAAAEKLVAVGCFCIGTNQVSLGSATKRGIPVFNAPFSNTRSVAELVWARPSCWRPGRGNWRLRKPWGLRLWQALASRLRWRAGRCSSGTRPCLRAPVCL